MSNQKKDEDSLNLNVPLTDKGEHQVVCEDTLPAPPPNKKIHDRRPLPIVPRKRPRK